MPTTFVDGNLVITEEIRLQIPTPFDIPIPVPPLAPSFSFPPIPDVPGDIIKIEARIAELTALQELSPPVTFDAGGSVGIPGSGGSGSSANVTVPSAGVDFDALLAGIDIPIPTPPLTPSFSFPPIPDVPGDIIKIEARIAELTALQANSPPVIVDVGGSVGIPGSGGVGTSMSATIPSAGVDFDALLSAIDIPIVVPPVIPSFSFPEIPDPTALFGDLGIDTELYKASENNPGAPGYSPTAPEVTVKVFINDIET